VCVIASALLVPAVVTETAAAAPSVPIQDAREVRTTWTDEFGVPRPSAVTYVPSRKELLVGQSASTGTSVVRLDFDEQAKGSSQLPPLSDPETLAFDASDNELTAISDGSLVEVAAADIPATTPTVSRRDLARLAVQDPQGAAFDPATGTWYVLDAKARTIARVPNRDATATAPTTISLSDLGTGRLRGLAFNPEDGLLYVGSPDNRLVYALDNAGTVKKAFNLAPIGLRNPTAMTFAPSTDSTDPASRQNLFVAQSGDAQTLGGVTEVTLAAAAAVVEPPVTATLVQTIDTSRFSPASPDPSGIAYIPGRDRLEIADSEVEEVTGAGYHGVNLWQLTRSGSVTDTGTTFSYSKEPTGLGFDPATNTLFISDDSARRIHVVKPGPDGRFGNADDTRTFINAAALGSDDVEDPAFDTTTGHLFFTDAVDTEIFDINPVNGVFGDGNDVVTHFDVGQYGPTDTEGLAFDSARNTLLAGDRTSRRIYEVTKTGELVRIIDARVTGLSVLSGMTVAPAVDNAARRDYWIVSRGVDNGANSNENDGKVVEVSIGGSGPIDTPPTVTVTDPAEGSAVAGASVAIRATATDDKGVTRVEFFDGATSLGTDTNGADGWSITWNTTTAADGAHVIRATATDTTNKTTSDTNNVTVDNSAPSVGITSPTAGATVSGTTPVTANATDPQGLGSVTFFVDGTTAIGTDTNGADGWSVPWNTATSPNGGHALTARAVNRGGLATTSAQVQVTVSNTQAVALDIPIRASGDDVEERASNGAVSSTSGDLEMMLDGTVVQSAVGMRFTGIALPRGTAITNAYVQFRGDEAASDPTTLKINGVASDNAGAFTTVAFNVSRAARTTASASWSPGPWAANQQGLVARTPNLAPVIQEIISRPGWTSGNALALVVTGSGRRAGRSFDGGGAAILHIEYVSG
jgi:uncharacterized protein YjiK